MNDKFSISMRYGYKRDLLTLMLISLFIFGACENPTGIGLEVDPEDQIEALFTDTVSIQAFTEMDDSVQSASFNHVVFGLFNDPIFGRTKADLAVGVSRPNSIALISPEAEIDSVVLILPYGGDFYGDTLASTYTIRVRQLAETYEYNTYSSREWEVEDEVL